MKVSISKFISDGKPISVAHINGKKEYISLYDVASLCNRTVVNCRNVYGKKNYKDNTFESVVDEKMLDFVTTKQYITVADAINVLIRRNSRDIADKLSKHVDQEKKKNKPRKRVREEEVLFSVPHIGSLVDVDGWCFKEALVEIWSKCATVRCIVMDYCPNNKEFVVNTVDNDDQLVVPVNKVHYPRVGFGQNFEPLEHVQVFVLYEELLEWWPAVVTVVDNVKGEYQGYLKYSVTGMLVPFTVTSIYKIRKRYLR